MSRMRTTRKKRALAIQVATVLGATTMAVSPADAGKTKTFKNDYFNPSSGQKEGTVKIRAKKVSRKKASIKTKCSGTCGGFKKVSKKFKKVRGEKNNYEARARIDGEKCRLFAQIYRDGVFVNYSCPSGLSGGYSAFKNSPSSD